MILIPSIKVQEISQSKRIIVLMYATPASRGGVQEPAMDSFHDAQRELRFPFPPREVGHFGRLTVISDRSFA